MSPGFPRSLRSLAADSFWPTGVALIVTVIVLAAWSAWFLFARVTLYEVSDKARLEVVATAHAVDAPVAGRVVATHLEIGRDINAGDVLVEVEAQIEQLRFEEERARLAALVPQRTALDHEIAAEREVITETRAATRAALAEADRQLEQAVAQASLAEDQASRHERLFAKGLVAEGEIVRARVEARDRRAAVEGRRLAIQRLEAEQQAKERTSLARLAHLQQQRALLDGQLSSTTATVARLKRESERRRIRAPVDGQLAEVATLRIGSVVREGDRLASVLPRDRLRGVAAFLPEALGRVKAEQRGRFRLDSFPSTQYGSIPVRVVGVGGEPRDGVVRVEFEIEPDPTFPAPLRHGLPGILEVAVEYVTPAALVLRTAGALITLPPAARRVGTPQR